jgi:hypothetical protein
MMMMMMMMMWPTPSAVRPLTLYNLTTSQHHHFSPEDGDSIFSETLATTEQPIRHQNPKSPSPP